MRSLILSHASAAERAVRAALERWPSVSLDVVVFGQGAEGFEALPRTRLITAPESGSPRQTAQWVAREMLRVATQRYHAAVIAQPGFARSQVRGALLSFAAMSGARQLAVFEPEADRWSSVGRFAALRDGCVWLAIQSALAAGAPIVGFALYIAGSAGPRPPRRLPARGDAIYLRTDLELASSTLRAGGSAAHTEGIVRALITAGYPTLVASTGAIAGLPRDAVERRLPATVRPNVPTEALELWSGLRQASTMIRTRSRGALVYQRYSLNNLCGLLLARRLGVPLVLEANASEVSWRRRWSRLRFGRVAAACERLLLRRADRIAAVSENAAKEIIAAGAPAERVRVIPNAVDVDRFASAPPVVLPFADDAFIVAFAGLFYPWHGVPTLARAFVELVGARPESRLLLVGDGASAPQVRAILREAGVDGLAYLPGLITREEVPGYLAASTVLVSPHVADRGFIGSPLKVFEYMASGRPIVSTRVAQLEQIFEDERTALLVAPDDPMALSQALVRLHDEPELRRSLGAAALHEARTKHTWDARLAALMA